MMADKTPKKGGKKRLRGIIGLAFSLITLAALTYLTVSLLSGDGEAKLRGILSGRTREELASEFQFNTGKDRRFADLGDGIAAVGSLGVQVLSRGGEETLRDVFQMTTPAIKAENGRAIAYDVGGTALRVFDSGEILHTIEAKGPIVSAAINRNGWFCAGVQEGGGYKGTVTVYNAKGKSVYRFDSAEGYVLDTALGGDNKTMAVLTLTDTGSRITLYNLNDENPEAQINLDGGLIIDIKCTLDGRILAFSKNEILLVDKNGEARTLFDFEGKVLRSYAESGGLIAVYLLDYGVGGQGRLITLGLKDEAPRGIETEREIISMSIRGETAAVLRADGLTLYDGELETVSEESNDSGASLVLALEGGVLVAGDYSAMVTGRPG